MPQSHSHVTKLASLVLLAGLALCGGAQPANDAVALLTLPQGASNWDSATAALPGAAWQSGTSPCGDGGATPPWRGLTCSGGQVVELNLAGMGLDGTLPAALGSLQSLTTLDLSSNKYRGGVPSAWMAPDSFPVLEVVRLSYNLLGGVPLPSNLLDLAFKNISLAHNRFVGPLPSGWASPTLRELDLSFNNLTGTLPPSWGNRAMPNLELLWLEGNRLEGMIPMPEWTNDAFASPVIIDPFPGNGKLCGPVLPLNPDLFPPGNPEQNQPLIPAANQLHTGQNMTHVILTQRNLFIPGTEVTVTNWLGSCMTPCNEVPDGMTKPPAAVSREGLAWPPTIQTNIYDISWAFNMTITDLVMLNPNASQLRLGANLSVPCYPDSPLTRFGYYGGSVAFGQFSGGNQKLGAEGLPGAMAAARINGNMPNQFHWPSVYTGNMVAGINGSSPYVLEPIYWFVDLLTPFHITNVLVTAGGPMKNASVYVGSDSSSVTANTRVAGGLNLAAGQQLPVAARGTLGRYVVIYGGSQKEGTLSLDDVQVYTFETNAAAFKPVTASNVNTINRGGASVVLQALVDNDPTTCVQLQPAADSANPEEAWALVDLGYLASVGSISVLAGNNTTLGTTSRVYVTRSLEETPTDAVACTSEGRTLNPEQWTTGACNKLGRYVSIRFPSLGPASEAVELCEFQVALAAAPSAVNSSTPAPDGGGGGGGQQGVSDSGGGLSSGAVAGIVLGALVGAVLLVLVGTYLRWRHRWLVQQRMQLEAVQEAEDKEPVQPLPFEVQGYGDEDGDEEAGGGKGPGGGGGAAAARAGNGGAAVAVAADGVVVTGAGKAVVPLERGWDKPLPPRLSELQLIGRFFTSLRQGGPGTSLSQRSSQESGSRRRAGFSIVKGGAAADHANATTDLTKLPPGFLEVSPADIKLVECVGEGSFGEVWLAEYCGALVAVKILAKVKSDFMTHSMQQQLALRNLQKEALLMSKLRHPNVCLYLGAVTNPPCLVMEYCAKCSLDHLLRAGLGNPQMAKRLTWVRLLSMALDAAKGMLYLHSRIPPIAHRDLKSANLLVDSQWRVKVADFSLSRALEIGSTAYTVVSTNPRWLAPEVLSGHPGQLPADVWAFGTVLWEMCTWRLPFENLNTFQIIAKVQSQGSAGLVVPPPEELPAGPFSCYLQFVELMKSCWAIEPEQRPTFAVIKEQLADMLTAEMLPHQQALAAAAAAEKAARAAAMAANGPALHAMDVRLREQQAAHAHNSSRNSRSSSGRGASLGNSLGAGSSLQAGSTLQTASGSAPGSRSHSHSQDASGGGSGTAYAALPPGHRLYE